MSVRARVHMTRNHPRFRTQIKNRFRGGEAPGGYRDVNVSVMYRGLVCEVQARSRARARACAGGSLTAGLPARAQLHISAFFELKEGAHSCYGICRELGLAGEVADPQKSEANSDVDGQLTVPQGVVAHVAALRFSAGGCARRVRAIFSMRCSTRFPSCGDDRQGSRSSPPSRPLYPTASSLTRSHAT